MSGLAAVLSFDAPVTRADVTRLCEPGAYRGPDGVHTWIGGQAGLGYLSRRTLPDRDTVAQPLVSADGELALVLDGRIDNREDLAARLNGPQPDAALALAAYQRWGRDGAAEIIGDFAIAVWDARRRTMYCARDAMGVRPLYYHASPGRFVCASDIAQVLAAPGVSVAPNEGLLGEYLSDSIVDRHETVYAGVFRVPAGHWLEVSAGRPATPRRYWSVDPRRAIHYRRDGEYGDHFRQVFMTAVADRLRSPTPVGVYFSGGTDSSAVIATACAVATPAARPAGFTLAFDRPEADERVYVDDLARFCGFESVIDRAAPVEWEARVRGRDVHDFLRDAVIAPWKQGIAARGYRVMLSGEGGDGVFLGSNYHYADLLRSGRFVALARQARADARMPDHGWSPSDLIQYGAWPLLPRVVKRSLRGVARRWTGYRVVAPWIEPSYAKRVGLEARLRPAERDAQGPSAARDDLRRELESGWSTLYREAAERESEEHGLEDRHPFLDRRVVEFGMAIPDDQRWRGAVTRYVVRNGLAGIMSPMSRARLTRAHGIARVADGIRAMEASGLFTRMRLGEQGWIQPEVVRRMYARMWRRHEAGDPSYAEDAFPLWMIAGTELWYRRTFDRL